jgi:hypothetical protein
VPHSMVGTPGSAGKDPHTLLTPPRPLLAQRMQAGISPVDPASIGGCRRAIRRSAAGSSVHACPASLTRISRPPPPKIVDRYRRNQKLTIHDPWPAAPACSPALVRAARHARAKTATVSLLTQETRKSRDTLIGRRG